MFFRSERLFLRPAWPEDWAAIHHAIAEEAVVKNLSRVPWPYTEADARWFASQPQDPRLPHCLITRPGAMGSEVIGCVGLAEDGGEVELGYWIARPHWGQGYATEAARAMLTLARGIGHRRIVARHFLDNPASGQVLRRLGFRPLADRPTVFCAARGGAAVSARYEIALDPLFGDCDDTPDGGMPTRRAA